MIICLSGIFAHVIRKAITAEEPHVPKLNLEDLNSSSDDDDNGFNTSQEIFRPRSNPSTTKIEGLPLLYDSESEDDLKIGSDKKVRSGSTSSDNYYLRENRIWTSTRDRHLEMAGLESDEELNTNEILVQTVAEESKEVDLLTDLLSD